MALPPPSELAEQNTPGNTSAGSIQVHLEADAPRASWRIHGVIVAAVPWARHQTTHGYVRRAANIARLLQICLRSGRGHRLDREDAVATQRTVHLRRN